MSRALLPCLPRLAFAASLACLTIVAGCIDGTTPSCDDAGTCGPPVSPPHDASVLSDAGDAGDAKAPDGSGLDSGIADSASNDAANDGSEDASLDGASADAASE